MFRGLDRYRDEATGHVSFFAERKEASVYNLMDEASLGYEEAVQVILSLYQLELIEKLGEAGEVDINRYIYALTYRGLKYYLEQRRLREGRERLDEVIRLHKDKSVVLKYLDAFKEYGLDRYIVDRFRRMHEYRLHGGYLDSIRYFLKLDARADAVEVLGLDYLVMEEDKVKKMLAHDYEPQMRLFEALRRIPELNSLQEKYLRYVENRAQHVLNNIMKWRSSNGLS